jgi:hypothetical protein
LTYGCDARGGVGSVLRAETETTATEGGTRLNHDGCETVIAHPLSPGSLAIGLLLGGGPLLYVATQTWFLRVTTKNQLTRRWIACAILATTIPIGAVLPALAALGLVAVTLATLAAYAPRRRYTPSVSSPHSCRTNKFLGDARYGAHPLQPVSAPSSRISG